jgi:hypothetical protein
VIHHCAERDFAHIWTIIEVGASAYKGINPLREHQPPEAAAESNPQYFNTIHSLFARSAIHFTVFGV